MSDFEIQFCLSVVDLRTLTAFALLYRAFHLRAAVVGFVQLVRRGNCALWVAVTCRL